MLKNIMECPQIYRQHCKFISFVEINITMKGVYLPLSKFILLHIDIDKSIIIPPEH